MLLNKTLLGSLIFLLMASGTFAAKLPYDQYPVDLSMKDELIYSPQQSVFQLWAPTAEAVELSIYNDGEHGASTAVVAMNKAEKGTWNAKVDRDLKGKFYTFKIKYEGCWLKETPGILAKAVGVNGNRAAIINFRETNPINWNKDKRPPLAHLTDAIIYEMHHRDFSVSANSGIKNKGKFLAITEKGTKNQFNESTGTDHLKELGVTHLHLLPSYDYASVDETKSNIKQYNWGYDPKNYNVPEGSYATNPYNPTSRIKEFKQMVQSAHSNGLRIIMDVVYNHTFANDDSNFSLTVPGYFYRHDANGNYSNASGCNNETASERAMMRHYFIESVKYWAKEYHVDGFRFDLMGIHDIETMNQIRKALDAIDPTIIIYGEGWMAGASPLPENKQAIKRNGMQLRRIAVFSDDIRDGIKGAWNDAKAAGFVGGKAGLEESVKFGIVGATLHPQVDYTKVNYSKAPYANNPDEVINYVSCHDDMCLNDKLKESANSNDNQQILKRRNKLAQTIVFTSQGIPFMLSGEELFRNKKGVHNSFASPDSINELDWNGKHIHADIFTYYKQLIALRKSHPAFRMGTTAEVAKNIQFLDISTPNVVGYTISNGANGDSWNKIILIFNGNDKAVDISIPSAKWTVVGFDGKIDLKGISVSSGGTISIPPVSAFIAHQ